MYKNLTVDVGFEKCFNRPPAPPLHVRCKWSHRGERSGWVISYLTVLTYNFIHYLKILIDAVNSFCKVFIQLIARNVMYLVLLSIANHKYFVGVYHTMIECYEPMSAVWDIIAQGAAKCYIFPYSTSWLIKHEIMCDIHLI